MGLRWCQALWDSHFKSIVTDLFLISVVAWQRENLLARTESSDLESFRSQEIVAIGGQETTGLGRESIDTGDIMYVQNTTYPITRNTLPRVTAGIQSVSNTQHATSKKP
jgi:hypothetical protein